MDCSAFCTASSYRIKALQESLKGKFKTTLFKDTLYAEIPIDAFKKADLFFFPYGAIVLWGVNAKESVPLLSLLHGFEEGKSEEIEMDEFTYIFGENAKIAEDEITLPNHDVLTKLAISHGIAQSVKLGAFEAAILKTFENTKKIPEDLSKYGKISLSRREIRRKMGQLFIERNSINLHVDALDTPDFFWDHPEVEHYYLMIANELDIETRAEVLDKRLSVVKELFEMLGNELNHQHSNRLEVTIIILIILEVIISLFTLWVHHY